MWALFALHRTVARVCARLVPVCWFGGKKNLAIRKTVGVFKAKAAIPSHFRLCTSASFRENLHRGPHRVFRSQAEQTFLVFFKRTSGFTRKGSWEDREGLSLSITAWLPFWQATSKFASHPIRSGAGIGTFFFFLAAFLILFGVGGLLAAPNPQPPSRERSQREARAWGDFKGHAVQLKSPVKPNRVALTNYFAPGWTRALPLKGTGEARRVYIYRYYWCLPTFFFFFPVL